MQPVSNYTVVLETVKYIKTKTKKTQLNWIISCTSCTVRVRSCVWVQLKGLGLKSACKMMTIHLESWHYNRKADIVVIVK